MQRWLMRLRRWEWGWYFAVLRKWLLMAMQFGQPSTLEGVEPTEFVGDEAVADDDHRARNKKDKV